MIKPLERALIVREPWASLLITGAKTWEMRSRPTKVRGRIGIIAAGSGFVMGEVYLNESLEARTPGQMHRSTNEHRIVAHSAIEEAIKGGWIYPWVVSHPIAYPMPRPYKHPSGAVIWVKLGSTASGGAADD